MKDSLNKHLYKIELYVLKIIPMLLALCSFLNTTLFYFGIDLFILSYLGGISFLTLSFLYLSSYVFHFCIYHRMYLHYVTIVNIISYIDMKYGIPVSDFELYVIYLSIALIFIVLITTFKLLTMFSTLTQNSVLYVWDLNNSPKVLQGTIERVSIPRPRYKTFNPTLETIVDITAVINGEKREFKDVPNNAVADFGENSFVIAESKDALNAYINSKYQNAKGMIENAKREEARLPMYEESLEELNPTIKYEKEKDKVIASLQDQIKELKDMVTVLVKGDNPKK